MAETELLSETVFEFGEFCVDLNRRRVCRKAEPVKLTPKPFGALEFLLLNRSRVVSREELLQGVWGGRREINTVEQAISQLRRVLGDDAENPRYIETVPGEGYRWVADIRMSAGAVGAEIGGEARAGEDARAGRNSSHTSTGRIAENEPAGNARRRWSARWVLAAGVGIATILVASIGLFVTFHYFQKAPHIARVTISGDTLLAMDATGRELWRHVFDGPLREPLPGEGIWRTQIADLKGDGNPEVLVAAAYHGDEGPGKEELFCFSSRGQLEWRYRPERYLEFKGGAFDGPWRIARVLVVPEGHSSSIWVAVDHEAWWPAYIVRLSPAGASTIVFTSSGMITTLHRVRTTSGNYILVAGVNNEYSLASLAVLAEHGLPATSPQSDGSAFECIRGCPIGRPYRYILLPRSELNEASGDPYNRAIEVFDSPSGVTVKTTELSNPAKLGILFEGFVEFSRDLQPIRLRYSDTGPKAHEQAQALGWIKHSFDNCPERRSPAVLSIADENGKWSRVEVPRAP